MRRIAVSIAVVVFTASCMRQPLPIAPPASTPPPIIDGSSLILALHDAHAGRWFTSLTWYQTNTIYDASGAVVTTTAWWERTVPPGRARIDNVPLAGRSGVLYATDSVFVFDAGQAVRRSASINPLLLLTIDIHAQPVARTIHQLDSLGFAMDSVHRDSLDGAPMWVLGAAAGDTISNQLWVDAERLIVRRIRMREQRGGRDVTSEWHLDKVVSVGDAGAAVATEVVQYRDGRLALRQLLSRITANEPVPAAAFDPAQWTATQITPPAASVPRD